MATYLMKFAFTPGGIRNLKASPDRVGAAKQTVRSLGGEVKAFYAVLGGDFDTLFVLEAPNDEAVAGMALAIASLGNVRTSTHRALTEEEFERVVAGLGSS